MVDAADLLRDPPGVLRRLCVALGIAFDPAMLSWPPGPRPTDGVWARHWYAGVHRSAGFEPYRPPSAPFPPELEPLLFECLPLYERLRAHAIEAPRIAAPR